jgi:predicted dithiol-disulfide oxidoreductase (DUF899 family)
MARRRKQTTKPKVVTKSGRNTKVASPKIAKPLHDVTFPNESASYRVARNDLLKAEMDLRRQIEHVATMRAKLPPGGGVPTDYIFEEGGKSLDDTQTVRKIRLSELFGDKQTLVAYSYMYGPQMAEACPNCTSIIDGLNGAAEHIGQRVSLVVIAKSPIARIREMARQRGWHRLRLLSSAGNSYNHDYKGEKVDGSQIPSLNVFIRKSGKIQHFFNTELLFAARGPGRDPCHVDLIWPQWHVFDLTPEGRGNFYPKLSYAS